LSLILIVATATVLCTLTHQCCGTQPEESTFALRFQFCARRTWLYQESALHRRIS
jgi:hypothetical protein